MRGLDVALAELRAEAFEQPASARRVSSIVRSAVVFSSRSSRSCLVSRPWRSRRRARRPTTTWMPAQAQLLLDPHRAVAGMRQRMVEHRLLDLGRAPGWDAALGAGQPVDQRLGAVGLEVAADLVELLAGVAHHLAGPADVAEILRQLEQGELATCYPCVRGHVDLLGWMCCVATPS